VVIGSKRTGRLDAELPVPPHARRQCQQPLRHPGVDPWVGPAAVAFQGELVFEHADDRFDPLAEWAKVTEAGWLATPVGAAKPSTERGEVLVEHLAGDALVADEVKPHKADAVGVDLKQRLGDLAFAKAGAGQAPGHRHPIGVVSRYSLRPQYQREWLGHQP
jgi:hypothetical protein